MNILYDSLDVTTKDCGCVITSNLDIVENIITDQYAILCKSHYSDIKNKKEYTYNKNKGMYILNSFLSKNSIINNIKKSYSYLNLNQDTNKKNIILFGKYKYKTFDYVYNNDKLYCYKLSLWNDKIYNNDNNILHFINYIKKSINAY